MLTRKRQRFVEEYLVDLNAKQAAIRAGYSAKTAEVTGCQILKNLKVREAVDKVLAEKSKRTGISIERVLQELAKIAFLNSADLVNEDGSLKANISRDDMAAVASMKVKTIPTDTGEIVERDVKFCDKLRAIELLGKHLGMFTDKFDVNMQVNLADVLKKAWEETKRG